MGHTRPALAGDGRATRPLDGDHLHERAPSAAQRCHASYEWWLYQSVARNLTAPISRPFTQLVFGKDRRVRWMRRMALAAVLIATGCGGSPSKSTAQSSVPPC